MCEATGEFTWILRQSKNHFAVSTFSTEETGINKSGNTAEE